MTKVKLEMNRYFVEALKEQAEKVSMTLWTRSSATAIWPGKTIVNVSRSEIIELKMLWHVLQNFLNNAEIDGEKLEWNQKYGHEFSPWHEPYKNPIWMKTQPGHEEWARKAYDKDDEDHPDHPDYTYGFGNPYNREHRNK